MCVRHWQEQKHTQPSTRHRRKPMQPQEGTLLPTSITQQRWIDNGDIEFHNEAPYSRRQQQWWYSNNDNDNKTPMERMAVLDKILAWFFSLSVSKNKSKEWGVAITYQNFFVLNYQKKCCVENETN